MGFSRCKSDITRGKIVCFFLLVFLEEREGMC